MKKVDHGLLKVQIPFGKNTPMDNLHLIMASVFTTLQEKALPEHKYLTMVFVLSDEAAGEDAESEEA